MRKERKNDFNVHFSVKQRIVVSITAHVLVEQLSQ
jgi:hypothetical protein